MEIFFYEESRLGVWSIVVDGKFWGLVVNTRDHPYYPTHEFYRFSEAARFEMFDKLTYAYALPDWAQTVRMEIER